MLAIVGCGTLGSRVAPLLQEHPLLLIDHDTVKEENLPQQHYARADVGKYKAEALAERLPQATALATFLDAQLIDVLQDAEAVVDCTDNLVTRELLGTYCHEEGIPLIHGAASNARGVAALFVGTPCMASLYAGKIAVDTCRSADIDPAVADHVANTQARLTERALQDGTHDGIHLLTADTEETVQLSERTYDACGKADAQDGFSITYCTMHGTLAAVPSRETRMQAQTGTRDGVRYRVQPTGKILFDGQDDVDLLRQLARALYADLSRTAG